MLAMFWEDTMITRRSFVASALAVAAAPGAIRPALAAEKWSHSIVKSKGDAAFFYMAQKQGLWAKRGLDVDLVELKGSRDVTRALIAGEVQSADANPNDVLPALAKGADLRFVGSGIEGYPYALYVRPEIKTWAELADKTFGVSSPGSAPHMFALAMLETNRVPTANIKIANAGGTTARVKALAAGKLDATAASTEFIPMVDELKIKVLGLAKDQAPLFPRFYEVMTPQTIAARRAASVNFLAGYMEGLRYCVDHRDEAIDLSAQINDEKRDSRYAFAYDEIVQGKLVSLNMEIHRDKIAWIQDMMVRLREQEKPVDIDRFIDTSVRDQALALVGRR
jgi:NitT/TauT family transport system substrate-binding protein